MERRCLNYPASRAIRVTRTIRAIALALFAHRTIMGARLMTTRPSHAALVEEVAAAVDANTIARDEFARSLSLIADPSRRTLTPEMVEGDLRVHRPWGHRL